MAKHPKLISRDKHLAYLQRRETISPTNICEGCPYNFACCRTGETLLFPEEVVEMSARTGLAITEFAEPLAQEEFLALAIRGVKVYFRLKTPCYFFDGKNCTIQDFKPRACKAGICDYAYKKYKEAHNV